MNTCKTCNWWVDTEEWQLKLHYFQGRCNHVTVNEEALNAMRSCCVTDTSDESGLIYTGPDFGCIHHEEKKPE